MKKIKVGLIYGGKSFEHDVSKMTAESIRENIDREKYEVVDIYIDRKGKYDESLLKQIDVAFLAVHGPNCEDGTLQADLERRRIKYTGPGVLASKLNMDKIKMHRAFAKLGLPIVDFLVYRKGQDLEPFIHTISHEIGYPCFVKANNAGSSVGVFKVDRESGLEGAVKKAVELDREVIVERAVLNPREVEVAVLGNDDLVVSEPGEILSNGEFYSYETKYFQPFQTEAVSHSLTESHVNQLKSMAERAYRGTGCTGYSRVDFLIDGSGKIIINEINTLPGFTKISMYPKMMAAAGIPYKELITRIIELALE